MWIDRLEAHGVSVVPKDAEHVRLAYEGQSTVFRVVRASRLHPRDVVGPPAANALLVVASLTEAAATRAVERGWSVVTDDGPIHLVFGSRLLAVDAADADRVRPPGARPGRKGYGIFDVLRILLSLDERATQVEIARLANISQARVSQSIAALRAAGVVRRGDFGWEIVDRRDAINWWVSRYPGPAGITTYWFGLDPLFDQVRRAVDVLEARRADPVVSGDVAADLVAPWRVPRRAVLYAKEGCDLSESGLTPSGSAESSLALVLPADRGVWPVGPPQRIETPNVGTVARASALHVLWDLRTADDTDSEQAADVWLAWMLRRSPTP